MYSVAPCHSWGKLLSSWEVVTPNHSTMTKHCCYHASDYIDEWFPANVPEGFLDYKLLINDCKSYHVFRKKPQQSSKTLYSIITAIRKWGMEILLNWYIEAFECSCWQFSTLFHSLDQVIMHMSFSLKLPQACTVSVILFYWEIYLLIIKILSLKFGWMLLCHCFPLAEI